MEREIALEMRGVSKYFGSVVANKNVNLKVYKGEILAVLGENGSGKTTLMNMISGIYFPDEGQTFVNGEEAVIRSPQDAFAYKIGMIHQHFKLVDVFTAAQNIVLGVKSEPKPVDDKKNAFSKFFAKIGRKMESGLYKKKEVAAQVKVIADKYGFEIDPNKKIYNMSVSEKQTVEILKEKGMDELFSAAEKLHDDGYKFVLDLVGFFEDEYKERVELLESKGVVKFHGFQEEPRPYYATADCVVMPSYHEGMSNVNLEASATGRPVITTDIPGCRESVENEYTGWLCEPKSVDSLYEKMKAFLETDISKREVMGKYARQKMVDEFDKKIVVNDTIKALDL